MFHEFCIGFPIENFQIGTTKKHLEFPHNLGIYNGKSYTKPVKHSFSKKNPNRKTKVNCSPREINEIDSGFF